MSKVTIDLSANAWTNILIPENEAKSIYTSNKSLVQIYTSLTEVLNFTNIDPDDIVTIGGLNNSFDTTTGSYVYARSIGRDGSIYHLPRGQADPEKNITTLSNLVNSLTVAFNTHAGLTNPHGTNKSDVGLSAIPNAITSNINETSTSILATINAVNQILVLLQNHTNNTTGNVHQVTKEQVGLGNVNNYPIATDVDIIDPTKTNVYTNIKNIYDIIGITTKSTCSLPPNTIVSANMETLASEDIGVRDSTTLALERVTGNVRILPGLSVVYCVDNKTYISNILTDAMDIPDANISTLANPVAGYHYVYVDIDLAGNISNRGVTTIRPHFGISRVGTGDWFDIVKWQMYDASDNPISRVYIGKVYVNPSGDISWVQSVPVGNRYIAKPSVNISPATTYLIDSPFMEPVNVVPEIKIGTQWCDPRWNDQVGVAANYDSSRPDKIVVQTGNLGVAMNALSAGNAFTSTNVPSTVNTSVPLRLIITKAGGYGY